MQFVVQIQVGFSCLKFIFINPLWIYFNGENVEKSLDIDVFFTMIFLSVPNLFSNIIYWIYPHPVTGANKVLIRDSLLKM